MPSSNEDKAGLLLFLSLLSALCFNFPVVRMLGKVRLVAGIPMLYFFIFLLWLLAIVATWYVLGREDKTNPKQN
jgi:hypothetical protein